MKIGMAVDRNGVPVGVLTDAANVGEPDLGQRVLEQMPEEVAVPEAVPVLADRGFDSDALRDDDGEEPFAVALREFREEVGFDVPGAPSLSVTNTGGSIVVSWPKPADNFVLDQTMDIL